MIGVVDDLTLCHLLNDIAEGIRVLHSRDGIEISEAQIRERARNIVMGLVGNYRIESFEESALQPGFVEGDGDGEADDDGEQDVISDASADPAG